MFEYALVLLTSTLRTSLPLIFGSFAGMWSERTGVINIALEGIMLAGAFAAATFAYLGESSWLGLFGAALGGVLISLLYGFFVLFLKSNQVVAGMGINLLVMGLTPFLSNLIFANSSSSPSIPIDHRLSWEPYVLGALVVGFTIWWFSKSVGGLRFTFAGEKPQALVSQGISVQKVRWLALSVCGLFAGMGGGVLSIAFASAFTRNMTAGRGFMALAALILGRWKPVPTLIACLFFGFVDALQIRLQGFQFFDGTTIPVQWIQIVPYVMTLVVLVAMSDQVRSPKYLGK